MDFIKGIAGKNIWKTQEKDMKLHALIVEKFNMLVSLYCIN